jgi:ubiquinone/menaquinone biosynthesis C-methylase UbiE
MDRVDYAGFYRALSSKVDLGESDLTPASFDAVVAAVTGDRVLDVACGKGLLASALAADRFVVGCDVALATGDRSVRHGGFVPCEALIEALPFADGAFDTVVSTHTLEHVTDLPRALAELRRVASRRLVIVVPRQRPYRVTFNPHVHFFPYRFSLLAWTGTDAPHTCELVGGDWLYVEERVG